VARRFETPCASFGPNQALRGGEAHARSVSANLRELASGLSISSDALGGEQGEKTGAGADIRNDIAPVDPEEIEELLRLLDLVPFRPVKPSGIPRVDQLSLALNAERGRLCCRYSRN
jgi:hypothetical protein